MKIRNVSGLVNAMGDSYEFPERDEKGKIIVDDSGIVSSKPGDVSDLLRSLLTQFINTKWAFWQGDSKVFQRIMAAINKQVASGSSFIEIESGDHEWLVGDGQGKVGILDRKMPPAVRQSRGVDESNEQSHPTLGMEVWGANESTLREYLKAGKGVTNE